MSKPIQVEINPQEICDTDLSLGLCIAPTAITTLADHHHRRRKSRSPCINMVSDKQPSLTLSLSDSGESETYKAGEEGQPLPFPSSRSAVSNQVTDEEDDGRAKKKLRLTKEQSAMLENRFKEHSTLTPKQKQALAKQLNLQPRQVEVWFQNRRARTKLKQTEENCELLKKCYEMLTKENQRLQKELHELKFLKFAPPPRTHYMQLPATAHAMGPSCESTSSGATESCNLSL
ncbi:homeobox-leucine zipper protein HOX19-like [Canna indica]|uniref:Homeobox-leucine zipper protein HOX19-like n=1 Tax=Canna indica TaxID=4628 RepID=A0AAQ3Q6N0_9LILI|nr:homeobox-leucine zipper protein HOX19-like [Canna indica]